MRIAILGGGPAGLYAAYLLKTRLPGIEVEVFEQNPADVTFGFGVVFSDRALQFLAADDPDIHAAIVRDLETWDDIELRHQGETIRIDGFGFAAVGRLRLLQILQEEASKAGVAPRYGQAVQSLDELAGFDMIIGADGANSLIRRAHVDRFGAEVTLMTNRFAWFGVKRPFAALSQTFRRTEDGCFNAHHYRYTPEMSTFLVEVDAATFDRVGLGEMDEAASRALCETIFAEDLDGAALISNRSIWRQFPLIHNARWSAGNCVLAGDALHTAHFSIGSGTRLALEDVGALVKAIGAHPASVPDALAAYEAARRPILEKMTAAANASASWYERFPEHMRLPPWEFAMSYIGRSGRVDAERLRRSSPKFMRAYEEHAGRPSAPPS